MKAVILAGGQGMRLRPMSLERPKPMTPLLGRPVLAHILALLRGQGIRDICVTLCCQPQSVVDYFGDGAKFGVKLTYFVEETPLGTAGSVKRCMGWLGDEDFLVVSGDCVCDLPVRQAEDFHRAHGGLATLVLYRHPAPLDYGLVCTGENGRVTEFLEKPAWGQVVTEQINTGIYVLSPAAMAYVPETGPYDFGKDLFPALLRRGEGVFGCLLEGYWRDMGDCGAYLACVRDALSGQLKLEMGLPRRGPGLWCAGQLPDRAQIVPPCWLGEGVVVRPGAKLGPYALLERGCQVGENAVVRRSVLLENSVAGENSALDGAILCPGAVVERGGSLAPGAVMGENARLGAGAALLEGVRLWPGQSVPALARLARTVCRPSQAPLLPAGEDGVFRGILGEDMGPQALLALGSALGGEGAVGLGATKTPGGRMLLWAAASGVMAAGGRAALHTLDCPAQGSWLAGKREIPVSLFIETAGDEVFLHLFDREGLPLSNARCRNLGRKLLVGEPPRAGKEGLLAPERMEESGEDWARDIAGKATLGRSSARKLTVAVEGAEPENHALAAALTALGCRVEKGWRVGVPTFRARHGGFRLSARDERGCLWEDGQLLALVVLIEMENGGGQAAVLPGASAAAELVAAGYGGKILRGEAGRSLAPQQPWMREGASAAVRICSRMARSGEKLWELLAMTPRFSAWKREIPLTARRAQVMEALAKEGRGGTWGEGLRLRMGGGYVSCTPLARREALRVLAEGPDLELAAELCDQYAAKIARLDSALSKQSSQESRPKE